MPLPVVNDILTNPNPSSLTPAAHNHPPVTGGNDHFGAKTGNLTKLGNTFTISGTGAANYWFIPAAPNTVSYCTVPCGAGPHAYVISTQYGGCEYHELYNAAQNMLAFLHVYRGDGAVTQYAPAAGWVVRSVKRSSAIAQANINLATGFPQGSNWSVSRINRANATVQSKFINVNSNTLVVTGEDNGDAPYPAPVHIPAPAPVHIPAPVHNPGGIRRKFKQLFHI